MRLRFILGSLCVAALFWINACAREKDYSCGGTNELRHWSAQRDATIMRRDGYFGPRDVIQIDHVIPLCLGGSDDDNLRVEFYPEAHWKDIEEQRLCRAVCAKRMTKEHAIETLHREFP